MKLSTLGFMMKLHTLRRKNGNCTNVTYTVGSLYATQYMLTDIT